jgi:hypothetical protein
MTWMVMASERIIFSSGYLYSLIFNCGGKSRRYKATIETLITRNIPKGLMIRLTNFCWSKFFHALLNILHNKMAMYLEISLFKNNTKRITPATHK